LRALLDDLFHSKLTLDVRALQVLPSSCIFRFVSKPELKRTFDKVGKADSDLITEVLVTASNKEKEDIRSAFHKETGVTLEKKIADGFSGSIQVCDSTSVRRSAWRSSNTSLSGHSR
jgi:hypothetical protein